MNRIRELTRIPPKLSRAYLAEDYDGIGQYVQLALSKGSTSGAYKARIAAGDFGGGRVFPVGTPVLVHVNRGQIEILDLGNLPKTGFEEFNRTETGVDFNIPGNSAMAGQFIGQADAGFKWDVDLENNNFSGDGSPNGEIIATVDGSQLILQGLNADSAGGRLEFLARCPADVVGQFFDRDVNIHIRFSTSFIGGSGGPFINFFFEVNEFALSYQNVNAAFALSDNALPFTQFQQVNLGFPQSSVFHFRARYTRATSRIEATCWLDSGVEPAAQLIYPTSHGPRTETPDPGFRFGCLWTRTSQVTVDYIRLESVT